MESTVSGWAFSLLLLILGFVVGWVRSINTRMNKAEKDIALNSTMMEQMDLRLTAILEEVKESLNLVNEKLSDISKDVAFMKGRDSR